MSEYGPREVHPVFQNVVAQWTRQIERARQYKEEVFGKTAREMWGYYGGPKSWDELMGLTRERAPIQVPDLAYRMHINKIFELVTLFGPSLYQLNPVRTVKPRAPVQLPGEFFGDPLQFQALAVSEQSRVALDGVRSILLEAYLNWTPSRYGLDIESRRAIDEALITGRGLLWTELIESPDHKFRAVISRFDSINHLVIDPDSTSLADAKWIARRCVQPVWQVEREFGLRRNSIKANLESISTQADLAVEPDERWLRAAGRTADLVVYWQVWSKMGMGGRLAEMNPRNRGPLDELFGDYAYLVICSSCRFPLNLPPDLISDSDRYDETIRAGAWPIPFWVDHGWPFSELDFHVQPDEPWPMAHGLAARGELRFLNWVFSFLTGHLHNSCRDFVAVRKDLPEEMKSAIISGKDLEIIELERDHGAITDVIQFLQHPQVNGDIWKYMEAVSANIDKRLGLNEVLYGPDPAATQPRSAAESNLRNQAAGIRPTDMAHQVEAWQAVIAAKEAFCSRYLLASQDVSVCLGPLASVAWEQFVFTLDMSEAFHALEYRIESGSTLRPNKEYAVRQMTEAMQTLAPLFQTYAQSTGDLRPLNNLIDDFCKSRDLDSSRYQLLAAPQPPLLTSPAPASPTPQGNVPVPPASGQPELG
jgi:hypothetical protein